jgi:hypothetical protein
MWNTAGKLDFLYFTKNSTLQLKNLREAHNNKTTVGTTDAHLLETQIYCSKSNYTLEIIFPCIPSNIQ